MASLLVALSGIVTFGVERAGDNANLQVCLAEYRTVQAGIDAYMAYNSLMETPEVPAKSTGTKDMMEPLALNHPGASDRNPHFVPFAFTRYYYVWDSSGSITQIYARGGQAPPVGCTGGQPRHHGAQIRARADDNGRRRTPGTRSSKTVCGALLGRPG